MHLRPQWICGGIIVLVACTPPAPNEVSRTEYQAVIAQAACARQVRCGTIGRSEEATCRQNFHDAPAFEGYSYDQAIAEGRLRFDGVAAAKCLEFYRSATCGAEATNGDLASACLRIYRPLVDEGGSCRIGDECRSSLCQRSRPYFLACPGVCAPREFCLARQCASEDEACSPGPGATSQCIPRGGPGAACNLSYSSETDPCQTGLVCIGGRCSDDLRREGQSCQAVYQCARGLYCDSDSRTCRQRLSAGAACLVESYGCQDGLRCTNPTSNTSGPGVCKPVLDLDSACEPNVATAPAVCPAQSVCDPGTNRCRPRPATLTSCGSETCVAGQYCDDATTSCRAIVPVGQACTPPTSNGFYADPCGLSARCDATTRTCVQSCG